MSDLHQIPTPEDRLHEGIGYVTPNDEQQGRGEAIGTGRRAGLAAAQQQQPVATRRELGKDHQ
jgi:putative transposase